MNHQLRWILLVPAVVASWIAVFLAFSSYHRTLTRKCESASPPECFEIWYLLQVHYLPAIGAAMAAILVVLVAYLVAPSAKVKAAKIAFVSGASVATFFGALLATTREWDLAIAAASAIIAGILAVTILSSRRAVASP